MTTAIQGQKIMPLEQKLKFLHDNCFSTCKYEDTFRMCYDNC